MLNLRQQHNRWLISEMPIGTPTRDHRRCDPIFTAPLAVQALVGGLGASLLGNALTGSKQSAAPQAPAVAPVTPMPTPGDANTKAAERKSLSDQLARRGRASTILTDNGVTDTLG